MTSQTPTPDPAPRRSLRLSLGYFVGVRLTMNTAYRFAYPFLPAISRGLGVSLGRGGILLGLGALAGVATPLLVGTAGRGRRRVRTLAVGLLLFTLGAALTAATGTYAAALLGFALMGVAKLGFDVAARAYVSDRTPYHRRARSLAVLELTWSAALLIGAPTAGWMIGRWGWRAPFWALAALGALGFATLWWAVDRDTPSGETIRARFRLDLPGAALMGAVALAYFSVTLTLVVFGAWLEDRFGLSLVALGGAAVLLATAELLAEGAVLRMADRIGPRRVVAGGLAAGTAAFALLAPAAGTLALGLAVLFCAFFAFEAMWVAAMPLATDVAAAAPARYLAALVAVGAVAEGAGAALGPVLFDWGGLALNAAVSAGACLIGLGLVLGLVRHRPSPARA